MLDWSITLQWRDCFIFFHNTGWQNYCFSMPFLFHLVMVCFPNVYVCFFTSFSFTLSCQKSHKHFLLPIGGVLLFLFILVEYSLFFPICFLLNYTHDSLILLRDLSGWIEWPASRFCVVCYWEWIHKFQKSFPRRGSLFIVNSSIAWLHITKRFPE